MPVTFYGWQYDKDMKCWVSAGFGFVAVKGGDGPEHDGGSSIHEHQGPVDLGDFGGAVTQKTNNVSELVAESVKSVTLNPMVIHTW